MRVVLCDEDSLLREMVESLLARLGFDIAGITDTTPAGVALIETARPDVVVFDMALGFNTDFDVLQAAVDVGARTIVFSHTADDAILSGYTPRPTVVEKPDLVLLEEVLSRLDSDADAGAVVEEDRRQRPVRAASGDAPTGPTDAQAFYSALQDVAEGDALVAIEVPDTVAADVLATDMLAIMRSTDRLLATRTTVRVYLPGGGDVGIDSFLKRLAGARIVPEASAVAGIVVTAGESAADVFDRLKGEAAVRPLPS
jgi:CheY-like chemotaxis protein